MGKKSQSNYTNNIRKTVNVEKKITIQQHKRHQKNHKCRKKITIQQHKHHQKNRKCRNKITIQQHKQHQKNRKCRKKSQSSNTNNIRKTVNVEKNHNPATQTTSEKP